MFRTILLITLITALPNTFACASESDADIIQTKSYTQVKKYRRPEAASRMPLTDDERANRVREKVVPAKTVGEALATVAVNRVVAQAEHRLGVFEPLPKTLAALLEQQAEFYSFFSRVGSDAQHAAAETGIMGGTLEIVCFLQKIDAWEKFAKKIITLREQYERAITEARTQ